MLIFTLRRLNLLIFTLLILSLLAYWIEYRLGAGDQSLWAGYLQFLNRLLAGDLGVSSQSGQPVLQTIMGYLPATLELCLAASLIAVIIGIPLGTLAALNQGRYLDIGITGFSVLGSSIPVYWLAQLLIQLARKEEEEQNPEKRETATASAPSDPELVQYVADRLKKLKPSKKETLLNSIGAMFQFQGGISDSDKEKLFSELLKKRHITIAENNRVHYPE